MPPRAKARRMRRKDPRGNLQLVMSALTPARVLELSNDLSEGEATGTLKDWRAVAYFWRAEADKTDRRLDVLLGAVRSLSMGDDLTAMGLKSARDILAEVRAENLEQTKALGTVKS